MYGKKVLKNFLKKTLLFRFGILPFLVPKRGSVVVTFHNLKSSDFSWFEGVLDTIQDTHDIADPETLTLGPEKTTKRPHVFLTFDDGFRSNYLIAKNILKPRGLKAIFFVPRKFINLPDSYAEKFAKKHFYLQDESTVELRGDYGAMNWDQVRWLVANGYSIGAHTDTHPVLSTLTFDEKYRQIVTSSDLLEQAIGRTVRFFAFPFGNPASIDPVSIQLVIDRFDYGFSNVRGMTNEGREKRLLLRQNLEPGMPAWLVNAIITGRLDWLHRKARVELSSKVNSLNLADNDSGRY
jgi:peptidoglycan/xylan/chitin deacetylase (PgdA/CDA1 family)